MKCAVHTDADAVSYCRNCGKPLCPVCARPVRDVIYCEDCLAATLGLPGPQPPASVPVSSAGGEAPASAAAAQNPYSAAAPIAPVAAATPRPVGADQRSRNATFAFIIGLVPGLGAVYNGEYNKALIHLLVVAAMIVGFTSDIGDSADVALAFLLAGFILYMAFDAMRTAKARSSGVAAVDPLETWSKERPIGPIILIGLGALFLLNNFSWFAFYRVKTLWPLILIGAGALMFRNRISKDF